MWESFCHKWEDDNDPAERKVVGKKVQEAAEKFVKAFRACTSSAVSRAVYLHIARKHVPRLIVQHGNL